MSVSVWRRFSGRVQRIYCVGEAWGVLAGCRRGVAGHPDRRCVRWSIRAHGGDRAHRVWLAQRGGLHDRWMSDHRGLNIAKTSIMMALSRGLVGEYVMNYIGTPDPETLDRVFDRGIQAISPYGVLVDPRGASAESSSRPSPALMTTQTY